MAISTDMILSVIGLLVMAGFAVFSSYRASAPRDDMRPKLLPWRLIMIVSEFVAILFFVHLINILGYETGPGKGLLGRF